MEEKDKLRLCELKRNNNDYIMKRVVSQMVGKQSAFGDHPFLGLITNVEIKISYAGPHEILDQYLDNDDDEEELEIESKLTKKEFEEYEDLVDLHTLDARKAELLEKMKSKKVKLVEKEDKKEEEEEEQPKSQTFDE